jgi:hypothetical protein
MGAIHAYSGNNTIQRRNDPGIANIVHFVQVLMSVMNWAELLCDESCFAENGE